MVIPIREGPGRNRAGGPGASPAPILRGADVLARRGPRDRRRRRRRHCRRCCHRCRGERRQGDVGEPQPAASAARPGRSRRGRQSLVPGRRTPARALMPERDRVARGPGGALVVEVRPPCSYRLPLARRYPDGVARSRQGVYERFLQVAGRPVLIRAWGLPREGRSRSRRCPPRPPGWAPPRTRSATREELEVAVGRTRNALAVDDDLRPFLARFARDPLLRPLIRRMPWYRVGRCPNPWEAFAWAVTEQLIESQRAALIQRRIVRRWGAALSFGGRRPAACRRSGAGDRRRPGAGRAGRLRSRPEARDRADQGGPRGRLRVAATRRTRPATPGSARSARSGPGRCSAWP